MIRRLVLLGLAALMLPAAAAAQATSRTVNYVGPASFTQDGVEVSVRGTVAISWPTAGSPNLFGEHWIDATLTDLSSTVSDFIVFNGRTYTDDDFGGALRPYFGRIGVTSVSMSLTVSNTQNCNVPHSSGAWTEGETVQRFCRATGQVSVATWRISRASIRGIRELQQEIRRLEREKEEADRKEREQATEDSLRLVREAREDSIRVAEASRRDSLERVRVAQRDSVRAAELREQDSVRTASYEERERERRRELARQDSLRRAREEADRETPERRRQREEYEATSCRLGALIIENQARWCTLAEAAYQRGEMANAIELFRRATEYPHYSSCNDLARRRTADASMTMMSNGAASLIAAIGQTFNVEAGVTFASFPLARDDMYGMAAGLSLGKGIYYADILMGNAIFAPVIAALNPVVPDYSYVGCSDPFGQDYYGNDCADYYNYLQTESRYRVNGVLTIGIISPKGADKLYLSGNLSYVMTDDGNAIIPAFGFVWGSRPTSHPRYGDIYSGGGLRVMFSSHQGQTGIQLGITTSW